MYDITNGWSFDGIDRWIREIDEVIKKKMCADVLCFSGPVKVFLFVALLHYK